MVVSDRPHLAAEIAAAADHAWGLVPPDIGEAALQAVLRAVAAGFTVVPPLALTAHVGAGRAEAAAGGPFERPRRRRLRRSSRLRAASATCCSGWPRACRIGPSREALGISEHTVKFHLASIFGKLGAGTRTEAVRLGLRQGLVTI